MKTKLKNQEKLSLQDLLARRKTTFESFVKEKNIVSFDDLVKECKRLNIKEPEDTFKQKFEFVSEIDRSVSNPKEGIIVFDLVEDGPLKFVDKTGTFSEDPENEEFVLDTMELSVLPEKHISDTLEPSDKKKKKKNRSIG
jgi:hypothetical protein